MERDSTVVRGRLGGTIKYAAVEALTRLYVPEIYVEGQENLKLLRKFRKQGIPTMITPNHLSHADAPILCSGLVRKGYQDIADNMVNYLGLRLLELQFLKEFLDAYPHIPVWPATVKPATRAARVKAIQMTREAKIATKNAVANNKTLGLFMESGRSYDGTLKDLSEISVTMGHSLLSIADLVIFPTAIIGSDKVLPVGKFIPQRANVRLKFGEPVAVADIAKKYANLPKKEMYAKVTAEVMHLIADLLPAQYRQAYIANEAA